MIYKAKCKLCKTEIRVNGAYNYNNLLYEHLKIKHGVEFKVREYKWDLIQQLEKEVNYDNWFIQD